MRLHLAIAFVCATVLVAGCAPPAGSVELSGRVTDETISIAAPPLAAPSRASTATVAAFVGLGNAVRIATVPVAVGDLVSAGDSVAVLETDALDAAIESTRAARRVAAAQIGVIDARLDDIADARSSLAENRRTALDTISGLESTRAELAAQLAAARGQRASIAAILAAFPPAGSLPPTGMAPPPGTVVPNPAQLQAALARLDEAIAKLEAAIARIDSGLAQARTGLARLDDATAQSTDARSVLAGVRRVARAGLAARDVAISLAEAQRDLAVLRSPVDGVVVATIQSGETVSAGAPVVVVRPDANAAVDVWVTPETAALLRVGDTAAVSLDSRPGEVFSATVGTIGARALFPPTWIATTEVHLMRAVPVRVMLTDPSVALPPGTPADVEIETETNR